MRQSDCERRQSEAACLALAAETSDDAIALLSREGGILFLNGAGRAALGFADASASDGADWLGCWSEDDRSSALKALRSAASGTAARFRARLAGPEHEARHWDTRVEPAAVPDRILAVSRDVTAQRDTEWALDRSHRLQQALIDATAEIVWHVDRSTGVTIRRGYKDFTGAPDDPSDMDGWLELVHPDDRDHAKLAADRADVEGQPLTMDYRLRHKSGEWRWVADNSTPLRNATGEVTDWIGIITDVHARRMTEHALRKNVEHLRMAAEATGFGMWHVDMRTGERDWSPELFDILDLPRDVTPTRQLFLDKIHPADRARVDRELKGTGRDDGVPQVCVFRLELGSGGIRWVEAHERTFYDGQGRPTRRAGTMQDITGRKAAEHEIWLAAHTDALTGAANRALFHRQLEEAIAAAQVSGQAVALLLIDLDRFKDVNDTLGHDAGDALLRAVATRLRERAPPSALVARLGGDEFGMIVPIEAAEPSLDVLAADLIAAVGEPVDHAGREMDCAASIGWAMCPDELCHPSDLLKKADLALYAAKSAGRNRAVAFAPAMQADFERRLSVLQSARDALARNAIIPFYQPKMCLRTGAVVGFEALLRWIDDAGLHGPGELLEAFDDPDLSNRLGQHMLEAVASDIESWNRAGVPFGHVALNVAAPEFQGGQLAERVTALLRNGRIAARQLEIEVTERVLLDDGTGSIETTLQALHAAGVMIALDDFGTGFASLTHLTRFPVSWVKIDRSFTSKVEADAAAAAIVKAVAGLAHAIGIKAVAEGVETREQLAFLQDVGCDLAQGFQIAKPMVGSRVPYFISRWQEETAHFTVPGQRIA